MYFFVTLADVNTSLHDAEAFAYCSLPHRPGVSSTTGCMNINFATSRYKTQYRSYVIYPQFNQVISDDLKF